MRAQRVPLFGPAIALATITLMSPAKEKATLLGAWEALDLDPSDKGDSYFYRMVLLPRDDGYLVWPRVDDREPLQAATFFGRLAKLEFKDSHLKLLFKRLPNQTHLGGSHYDSIEIEGEVVACEDMEELKAQGFAEIRGTTTVRREEDEYSVTRPLRMTKPGFVQQLANRLAANARRAEDLLAQEMKPGPQGSRDDALAILRESEVIRDMRVVSAEWSESSREWHVELGKIGARALMIAVNVPAHEWYPIDDTGK